MMVSPDPDSKSAAPPCPESLTDTSGTYPCLFHGPHGEHLVRIGGELLMWPNQDAPPEGRDGVR